MASNCLNCQTPITENFCGNCGQKKYKRIDRKYIIDEVQYSVLHTNKGFLYSVKNILKNPGKTARNFIEGNRVNHYKPILLAFVLSGISALLYNIGGLNEVLIEASSKIDGAPDMSKTLSFMTSYNSFLMLLFIPFFAVFTSIIFRKWGQNYYEHIVMNAFGLSLYTLIIIIALYPILYILRGNISAFILVFSASNLIVPFIFVWFYKGFYPDQSIGKIILKVLLIFGFAFLVYVGLIIALDLIRGMIKSPEAMKVLQQPK